MTDPDERQQRVELSSEYSRIDSWLHENNFEATDGYWTLETADIANLLLDQVTDLQQQLEAAQEREQKINEEYVELLELNDERIRQIGALQNEYREQTDKWLRLEKRVEQARQLLERCYKRLGALPSRLVSKKLYNDLRQFLTPPTPDAQ